MSDRPQHPDVAGGLAARLGAMEIDEADTHRAEMRRLAAATRLVIDRLVATYAPTDDLARAADAMDAIAASLDGHARGHSFDGFGENFGDDFGESANAGNPGAHFDHSPVIGRANPLAPPLDLSVADGLVVGTARFGSAYEGPPGAVHGGYVAAAFDEVLGMTQSLGGKPGMTGTLTVRYRRPTPLHTSVTFEGELVKVEGRKIFTAGRLFADGELRAEAEGIFISVDFSKVAEMMARRDPSP